MMDKLKVFISHSKDHDLADSFKESFDTIGLETFLDKNIIPSTEWNPIIIKQLKESDIFVPLISGNLIRSTYANQEIGMAIATNKIIIPIKLDVHNPPGFIDKIQAYPYNGSTSFYQVLNSVIQIFFFVATSYKHLKQKALNSVLSAFCNANCFRTTSTTISILEKLEETEGFTADQCRQIISAMNKNDQIYNEQFNFPRFRQLIQSKYTSYLT